MESLTPRPPTGVDELDPDAHARQTDPWTSHAAASTVNLTRRQVQVLEAFQAALDYDRHDLFDQTEKGMTDEDLVTRVLDRARLTTGALPGMTPGRLPSPSGIRTARKALERAGLVEKAPEGRSLRRTALGNWAFVFVLTEAGKAFEVQK